MIYLVIGSEAYGGFQIMRAFNNWHNAEDFANACKAHEEAKPHCPGVDAPDSRWRTWERKEKAWKRAHPAGLTHDSYSYYEVAEIEVGDEPLNRGPA